MTARFFRTICTAVGAAFVLTACATPEDLVREEYLSMLTETKLQQKGVKVWRLTSTGKEYTGSVTVDLQDHRTRMDRIQDGKTVSIAILKDGQYFVCDADRNVLSVYKVPMPDRTSLPADVEIRKEDDRKFVLSLPAKDGQKAQRQMVFTFDEKDNLIREDFMLNGEILSSREYSDYRDAGGVPVAFRGRIIPAYPPENVQTYEISNWEFDPVLPPDFFDVKHADTTQETNNTKDKK